MVKQNEKLLHSVMCEFSITELVYAIIGQAYARDVIKELPGDYQPAISDEEMKFVEDFTTLMGKHGLKK